MARPQYKIKTKQDFILARQLIRSAMQKETIDQYSGYTPFLNADSPEKLQTWCEDYLDDKQWTRLRNNIRKTRSNEGRPFPDKEAKVSIKNSALDVLKEVQEKTDLTYSEIIHHYLEPLLCGSKLYNHEGKEILLNQIIR